jgi:hypothetical protein
MDVMEVTAQATLLAAALREGSLDHIRALAAPDFWDRAGEADYAERLPVSGTVELLGILNDRSLLLVTPAAGADGERYALEQAWSDDAPPLLLDERYFSLLDAARERAEGDEERLARVATKLAGQDAAEALAAALARNDTAAVRAMVEPEKGDLADREADRAAGATRAELVGSVGPRTLVRVWSGDTDVTLEYLWRDRGDGWLIAMVREFSRTG